MQVSAHAPNGQCATEKVPRSEPHQTHFPGSKLSDLPSHHSKTHIFIQPQMTAHDTMATPVDKKETEDMFRSIGDTVDAMSGGGADSTAEERSNIEDPQIIDHIGMSCHS